MILPQSMHTEFIETASLYAYARLCKLRLSPDAQVEIREYAQAVSDLLEKAFPVSWVALNDS
jgi:thymidylate synthase (FAD)